LRAGNRLARSTTRARRPASAAGRSAVVSSSDGWPAIVPGRHHGLAGFPFPGSPRRVSPHPVRACTGRPNTRRNPCRPSVAGACSVDLPGGVLVRPCGPRRVAVALLLLCPRLTSPLGSGSITLPATITAGPSETSRGQTQSVPRGGAGFIKPTPFVDGGLPGHVPPRPERATPPIPFLFVATCLWLGLPSDPTSRRRPCPFPRLRRRDHLALRTFTSLVLCHARHTRPGMSRAVHRVRSSAWLAALHFINSFPF